MKLVFNAGYLQRTCFARAGTWWERNRHLRHLCFIVATQNSCDCMGATSCYRPYRVDFPRDFDFRTWPWARATAVTLAALHMVHGDARPSGTAVRCAVRRRRRRARAGSAQQQLPAAVPVQAPAADGQLPATAGETQTQARRGAPQLYDTRDAYHVEGGAASSPSSAPHARRASPGLQLEHRGARLNPIKQKQHG